MVNLNSEQMNFDSISHSKRKPTTQLTRSKIHNRSGRSPVCDSQSIQYTPIDGYAQKAYLFL